MHILIIRPGAIGDALLTFPVIQALRTQYSSPHITLVSNVNVLPLAVAFGLVEEVSDYGALQWSELFSTEGIRTPALSEQLERINLAICWLRDPGGMVEQNLRLAGAGRVVTAAGRPPVGKRMHVVDYLAETVGIKEPCLAQGLTFMPHKKVEYGRQTRVAIHPGSGGAEKCWPVSSFAAVIERLGQCSSSVLLLGGPADHERIDDLQRHLASPLFSKLIDAPLEVVAEQLQGCDCYLGNDSGITHLAAMLGIPTVALFGPSDPAVWRPVGPRVKVIQEDRLERLPVDTVVESILRSI